MWSRVAHTSHDGIAYTLVSVRLLAQTKRKQVKQFVQFMSIEVFFSGKM